MAKIDMSWRRNMLHTAVIRSMYPIFSSSWLIQNTIYGYIYMYNCIMYNLYFIHNYNQRKFSQETSELQTTVMGRIPTIMSTTSSCHPQLHRWKHSRVRSPAFILGKVVSVVAEVNRASFSALPRLDLQKLLTKSAEDCSESSVCISKG